MTQKAEIILRESTAIVDAHTLLRTPVKELTDQEAVTAWAVLDVMEKELTKKRKAAIKVRLFEMTQAKGKKTDKGSFIYDMPGSTAKITKERRKGKVTVSLEEASKTLSLELLEQVTEFHLTVTGSEYALLMEIFWMKERFSPAFRRSLRRRAARCRKMLLRLRLIWEC